MMPFKVKRYVSAPAGTTYVYEGGNRRTYQLSYPAPNECAIKTPRSPEGVEQVALHQWLGEMYRSARKWDGKWARQLDPRDVENVEDSP